MILNIIYLSVAYICLETILQLVRYYRQQWWREYWLTIALVYLAATCLVLFTFWQQLQILVSVPALIAVLGVGLFFYVLYTLSQVISQPILITDSITLSARVTGMIQPWWKELVIRALGLLLANITFVAVLLSVIGHGVSVLQVMSAFVGLLLIVFSILVWIWREALQVSWFISACIIPGVAYLVLFIPSGLAILWGLQVFVYFLIHVTFKVDRLEGGE